MASSYFPLGASRGRVSGVFVKVSRRMSITEVSKLAGVSVATVSRVLNGHPRVSSAMVEAVREAVAKVGYVPPEESRVGRPRRNPLGIRTGAVAVLFPDTKLEALRTALSGQLLHGIEEALRQRSLSMVVTGLPEEGKLPASIEHRQVDGVIVRGGSGALGELRDGLQRLPSVRMFEPPSPLAWTGDVVLDDNSSIGAMAARYLLDRGHRNLIFLNLLPPHPSFHARGLAFQAEACRAGAEVRLLTETCEAASMVDQILAQSGYPMGLFVPGADQQVTDVYRALKTRGVHVGRDVGLISCNNDSHRLASLDPDLANIDIQAETIGQAAVEMLLWRLQNPDAPQRRTMIAPRLVEPRVVQA